MLCDLDNVSAFPNRDMRLEFLRIADKSYEDSLPYRVKILSLFPPLTLDFPQQTRTRSRIGLCEKAKKVKRDPHRLTHRRFSSQAHRKLVFTLERRKAPEHPHYREGNALVIRYEQKPSSNGRSAIQFRKQLVSEYDRVSGRTTRAEIPWKPTGFS